MTRRVGISALERVEALVANPALYAFADAVPERDASQGGRPRQYPVFMWVLFDALLSVYGSGASSPSSLIRWCGNGLGDLIRHRFPGEPDKWLPATPMRRHPHPASTRWSPGRGIAMVSEAFIAGFFTSAGVVQALVSNGHWPLWYGLAYGTALCLVAIRLPGGLASLAPKARAVADGVSSSRRAGTPDQSFPLLGV